MDRPRRSRQVARKFVAFFSGSPSHWTNHPPVNPGRFIPGQIMRYARPSIWCFRVSDLRCCLARTAGPLFLRRLGIVFDLVFLKSGARIVKVRLGTNVEIPSAQLMGAPIRAWRELLAFCTKFYNALITSTHLGRTIAQSLAFQIGILPPPLTSRGWSAENFRSRWQP